MFKVVSHRFQDKYDLVFEMIDHGTDDDLPEQVKLDGIKIYEAYSTIKGTFSHVALPVSFNIAAKFHSDFARDMHAVHHALILTCRGVGIDESNDVELDILNTLNWEIFGVINGRR